MHGALVPLSPAYVNTNEENDRDDGRRLGRSQGERMEMRKTFALACFMTALAPPVWALSLRSPAKEIKLDGLRVGKTYSADAFVRTLEFADTGKESISIASRFALPRDSELKDGYEPIPSLSWIRLKKPRVGLAPRQEARAELALKIPDKEGFSGGQYQAEWIMTARGPTGDAVELSSRILIDLDDSSDAAFEKADPKKESPSEGSFMLLTKEAALDGVPLGISPRPLEKAEVALKILNTGGRDARIVLRVKRRVPDADVPPDFTVAPNPHFLRVGKPELRIGVEQIGIKKLRFEIPNEARYRGKKWVFLIEAKIAGSPDSQAQDFPIQVTTARKDSK